MNTPTGTCAVCDASIVLGEDTQVTEVITCTDCKTRLVVASIDGESATLTQAPAVEADWGE